MEFPLSANKPIAKGQYAHVEGKITSAFGESAHAEGTGCLAMNKASHAQGFGTIASGEAASSSGVGTVAFGFGSIATGHNSVTSDPFQIAHSSGRFQKKGDAQFSSFHVMGVTNRKESTKMCLDYPHCEAYPTIKPGSAWFCELDLVATDGSGFYGERILFGVNNKIGDVKIEKGETIGLLERGTLIGASVLIDSITDQLLIRVNSPTNNVTRWSGKLHVTHVGF